MENKGFKFFKKGSAFLIAPALSSSFLPGMSANTVGGNVASKAASKSAISKFGAGTVKFLGNHWVLALLVGAGLFAWWLWPSDESEGTSELGKDHLKGLLKNPEDWNKIESGNLNFEDNAGKGQNINNYVNNNNINNTFKGNNNNNSADVQKNLEIYRKEVSDLKNKAVVDTFSRVISFNNNRKIYYNWFLSADGTPLIKFIDSLRTEGHYVYELIFPTNEGKDFLIRLHADQKILGDVGEKFSFREVADLGNMEELYFYDKEFSSESFYDGLKDQGLKYRCGAKLGRDLMRELYRPYNAALELIKERDPNFWNMRNNPEAIKQDIQQQKQNMMAMNNNMGNNGMMMGNNNNQNFGNPQGMNYGFQGNNNGFPQQMGMNNP